MKLNKEALWEAVKEPLRLLLMALVAFFITQLTETKNPEQWIVGMVFLLRFVDKWMHEAGKAKADPKLAGGLTRF